MVDAQGALERRRRWEGSCDGEHASADGCPDRSEFAHGGGGDRHHLSAPSTSSSTSSAMRALEASRLPIGMSGMQWIVREGSSRITSLVLAVAPGFQDMHGAVL